MSWITLHPRTAAQKRRGFAVWSQIAQVKSWLKIPLIGNGDVQTREDIRQMFQETGCDRVMIGRALLAKPWLLSTALEPQAPARDPWAEGAEYGRFLTRILELSREHYPEHLGIRKFRFLVRHGSNNLEYGHCLQSSTTGAFSYDELGRCLVDFFGAEFERPQKMLERTSLRY